MDAMTILPNFYGILCHDHWKPSFRFDFQHVLCNAHHLRELQRAWEQDEQKWAKELKKILLQINVAVDDAGGKLTAKDSLRYRKKYPKITEKAHEECPPPDESQRKGKRERLKRSRSRNLLERLRL